MNLAPVLDSVGYTCRMFSFIPNKLTQMKIHYVCEGSVTNLFKLDVQIRRVFTGRHIGLIVIMCISIWFFIVVNGRRRVAVLWH